MSYQSGGHFSRISAARRPTVEGPPVPNTVIGKAFLSGTRRSKAIQTKPSTSMLRQLVSYFASGAFFCMSIDKASFWKHACMGNHCD